MNELAELIRIGEFDSLHISLDEREEKNSFTRDIQSHLTFYKMYF